MPTPIEVLLQEHRLIGRALIALSGMCGRLDQGQPMAQEDFDRLFDFLTNFADQRHHNKEERCLFPALGEHGIPRDHGPVGLVLQEHCTGRALIAHMRRAAGNYLRGDLKAAQLFTRSALEYVDLLHEHIDKENNVLFRLAQSLLDEKSLRSLQETFDHTEPDQPEAFLRYEAQVVKMERDWAR